MDEESLYRQLLIHRYDDNHITRYFSYLDFPGLSATPISFKTPEDLLVKGNLYFYPGFKKDSLIVFCHGIGGGHRSYMREIELLCKAGYQVLAYDNVGCFSSEGESIRGLSEAINDLLSCLNYLQSAGRIEDKKLILIGHSWGGYAVSNIQNFYHGDIHAIVVLSGFCSCRLGIEALTGKKDPEFLEKAYCLERKANPLFADSSSLQTLVGISTETLLIQSKDDPIIPYASCGMGLVQEKIRNPVIHYLEMDDRKHNPNYTKEAVDYLYDCFDKYNAEIQANHLQSFAEKKRYQDQWDYFKMTEQDPQVWQTVLEFIC